MQQDLEGNEVKVVCDEEVKTNLTFRSDKLFVKMSEDQVEKIQGMKKNEKKVEAVFKKIRIKKGVRAITADEYAKQEQMIISAVINGI